MKRRRMNEETPRSLSQNDASVPSPALIVGAKVALNPEGRLDEAEWKALAERLSMYSDKRYETARYFFVKDGAIVRQVAVSSQTPSSTLAFPDEGYHWKLREWALEREAKIVFCHNHPSGYTAPSEADERLTSRLSNFFNGDGEEVFLGHVILDHGSFGLYTPESGWKHFGPRGLEEFGKDEGGFFIRNWVPDLSRKVNYFPVANERGLLLLAEKARELDALDSWNSKDWVPAILVSKGGEIRSMEYANAAEFKAPDLLLSRMKEAGRLHGAGDLYLFPTNWDQAMLCRSFAAETNAVRGVCRLSEGGEPDVSFYANAELFGAPKKSEIIVEDTEKMPEAKARLEKMKENERMEKKDLTYGEVVIVRRPHQGPCDVTMYNSMKEAFDAYSDSYTYIEWKNLDEYIAAAGLDKEDEDDSAEIERLKNDIQSAGISDNEPFVEFEIPGKETEFHKASEFSEEKALREAIGDDMNGAELFESEPNETYKEFAARIASFYAKGIHNAPSVAKIACAILPGDEIEEAIEEIKENIKGEEKRPLPSFEELRSANQSKDKLNFVLDKLSKAGIEVVTDKAEFDRILEGSGVLQKMEAPASGEKDPLFSPDEKELKAFAQKIDDWKAGKLNPKDVISEFSTSEVLQAINVPANKVSVTQDVLQKINELETVKIGNSYGHDIDVAMIKKIPEFLADPVMVFNSSSKPGSYVIMSETVDKKNRTIMVAMEINKLSGIAIVNNITSAYGRNDNNFFIEQIKLGKLLYQNKEKSLKWSIEKGLPLPPRSATQGSLSVVQKEDLVNRKTENFSLDERRFAFTENQREFLEGLGFSKPSAGDNSVLFFKNWRINNGSLMAKKIPGSDRTICFEVGPDRGSVNSFRCYEIDESKNHKTMLGRESAYYENAFEKLLVSVSFYDRQNNFMVPIEKLGLVLSDNVLKNLKNLINPAAPQKDKKNYVNAVFDTAFKNKVKNLPAKLISEVIQTDGKELTFKVYKEVLEIAGVPVNNKKHYLLQFHADNSNNFVRNGSSPRLFKAKWDRAQQAYTNQVELNLSGLGAKTIGNIQYIAENNCLHPSSQVTQTMTLPDGEVYGFAHGGKVYLNPDVMTSEVAVHEYTHLWDAYTQRTNPELWKKGMDVFKDTKLWSEVKGDPNYEDIAGDDDLILSEVHARICGKMADEILSKIAERDGELKKDAAIDWDREVSEFVAKEFGAVPELGQEDYVSETVRAELLKEFLSSPMKDLMAGLQITKGRETSGQTKEETVETEEDKLMAKKKEKAPARRKARKPEETTEAREEKAEAAPGREGFKDEEASAEELYAGFVNKMREGWASMKEKEEKGEEPEYSSFAALFEGVGKSYSKADRVAISKKVAERAGTESPAKASEWLEKEISSEPVRESGEEAPAEGLEEPAPAVQEGAAPVPEQEEEPGVDALKKLLLEAQLRNDALNAKVSSLESVIASLQSQLAQLNAKLVAAQGREEPGPVQENASAAESGYGASSQGQQAPSPDPNQFSTQTMYRPGIPVPKFGVKIGEDEFDIKEGCRFKELLKNKDNPAMNEVVLERETEDGTIEKVKISEREYTRIASVHEKFEREKSQYAGDSYEWDYFHKKYGEEMGVDRNRTRMNTAANFLHNFKVWCRASAENPQDAMRIARDLVNGMSQWEKHRFNAMRNQWPAGGEDYDKMLVHVFEENSKLKGAAITADRRPGGPAEASMIYELNKDDIQLKKGELIPGTNKRVGETVKLAMKFTSLEGRTVATPQMTFEIVGCSKNLGERNTIILANREKNTRYEVPLDPVREKIVELEKSQKKELKREAAKAKKNALSLSENFESERKAQTAVSAAYGGRGM